MEMKRILLLFLVIVFSLSLFLVGGPVYADSTVTVDGGVSSDTDDDVSSISFEHTTGSGINRLMLVGVLFQR